MAGIKRIRIPRATFINKKGRGVTTELRGLIKKSETDARKFK